MFFLQESEKIENFIKEVPTKSPYLVYAEVNQASSDTAQVFVILDQDCECVPVANQSIFTSSVVTLVAVYYSFNLEYEQKRKHFFAFFEEHVLGVVPKRKPYILKQLENRLLSKMNSVQNDSNQVHVTILTRKSVGVQVWQIFLANFFCSSRFSDVSVSFNAFQDSKKCSKAVTLMFYMFSWIYSVISFMINLEVAAN